MSTSDIPAPPNTLLPYAPSEIILYGVQLNEKKGKGPALIDLEEVFQKNQPLNLSLEVKRGSDSPDEITNIALVFGYGFEGHCYRFDKPRILVFWGVRREEAEGCSFDDKKYSMWRVRTKSQMLELTASADFAEALVLQANLPDRRAPNTYNSAMMLAHRGGRLTTT
jgi:hypothetical protein